MNFSYWERETLVGNVDIVVVGSGLVGLFTALFLKQKKPALGVVVAERGPFPQGASSRNAGFACFGSISELLDDFRSRPRQEVLQLVERRYAGLQKLRATLGDAEIGFEACGGTELFEATESVMKDACMEELPQLNNDLNDMLGIRPFRDDKAFAKFSGGRFTDAIHNNAEGAVHTGKMIRALLEKCRAAGIELWNGIEIEAIEHLPNGASLKTTMGNIQCQQVAVCTNGFARALLPNLNVVPARNQVIVTSPIRTMPLRGTYHVQEGYIYFRNVGDRLLLGGFRHLYRKEEETTEMGLLPEVQQTLEDYARNQLLPGVPFDIEYRWAGIMGTGPAKSYICEAVNQHIFCGVRMGGMGVALSPIIAEDLSELVLGFRNS